MSRKNCFNFCESAFKLHLGGHPYKILPGELQGREHPFSGTIFVKNVSFRLGIDENGKCRYNMR